MNEIYEYVQALGTQTDSQIAYLASPFETLSELVGGDGLANYKFASFNTTHEADRQSILTGPSAPAKPNYSVAGSATQNPQQGAFLTSSKSTAHTGGAQAAIVPDALANRHPFWVARACFPQYAPLNPLISPISNPNSMFNFLRSNPVTRGNTGE